MAIERTGRSTPEWDIRRLGIGVDLDGTFADSHPYALAVMSQYLSQIRGEEVHLRVEDTLDWDLAKHPLVADTPGAKEFLKQLYYERTDVFQNAVVYPGALEVICDWRNQGYEVFFISGRVDQYGIGQATQDWFKNLGLDWVVDENRLIIRSPGVTDLDFKLGMITRFNLQVFIDDRPSTMRDFVADCLMIKILPAQPWNQNELGISQAVFAPDPRRFSQMGMIVDQSQGKGIGPDWRQIDAYVQETAQWYYFLESFRVG
ncbi:MAG TPA: hypothetical protein VMW41_06160 [Candidatus Bathyarchaeia archaeon]|nr:hypothetical protein [Candidatus Bathyarchaeia archaeon]